MINIQENILNKYKQYDKLNASNNETLIKILVSYIKPSFLFKSEVLTPIHLGYSVAKETSKDGTISQEDLKWLHENCITDNFEGGISEHNRRIGFLTGTYWAWKNFDKLDNPQYFGSFGYRRLLNPEFLRDLENYDLILPKKKDFKIEKIKDQFINYHGQSLYEMALKFAPKDFEEYCNKTCGYFDEIYVMKSDLFFDFCEWIFPILFKYLTLPQIILNGNDYRDIGFIMERLTGYYLNNLTKNKDIKYKEVDIEITEKVKVNPKIINKELLANLRKKIK